MTFNSRGHKALVKFTRRNPIVGIPQIAAQSRLLQ
uniref:Uncharacterized protein n=1 Tax=Anguilla anguilla TaxID=7936 RepID=A0A0E9VAU5_ANGAN